MVYLEESEIQKSWKNLKRIVDYLQATIEEHLIVWIDKGINLAKWRIDASFAVHDDFTSHTRAIL